MRKNMRVMGVKIAIKEVKKLRDGDDGTLAIAYTLEHKTELLKSLPPVSKNNLLIHEAVHHLCWQSGLSQYLTKEQEEMVCQLFAAFHRELKEQGL